jgi:glycine hydroxymethyltransferase
MITADVAPLGLDGRTARARCTAARVVLDTCCLPYGAAPPAPTTGIRLGSAAVTTQGMGEAEMGRIAKLVGAALREDTKARTEATELARAFPPYPAAHPGAEPG